MTDDILRNENLVLRDHIAALQQRYDQIRGFAERNGEKALAISQRIERYLEGEPLDPGELLREALEVLVDVRSI